MKILWLCSWYPHSTDPFDGDFIERHAKALSIFQKVDVVHIVQNINFLRNENPMEEEISDTNLTSKIIYLPLPKTPFKSVSAFLFNRQYYKRMLKELNEYILTNSKPDLVHVHVPVKMGAGALWLKRKFNIPFVVTEHSSAYFHHIPGNYFSRNLYFKRITRKTFQEAQFVSSPSNWLLLHLQKMFRISKIQLIRNAVNTSFFFPAETVNQKKVFIHVSMMHPLKNINGILRSLAQLNKWNTNWQMVFVGPASADTKKQASQLYLNAQIVWKGALSYSEVAKAMQQADALIHFSNYENLPCVVNEALCCGLPVISSNVGGIKELVNNTNGILVENGNTDQLSAAMISFLHNPDKFNKKLISKEASGLFSYEVIGNQLFEMYAKVLKTD